MRGRFAKGQSFSAKDIRTKLKCQVIDSHSQPIYKALAYLEQIRYLVQTKEISELPAGRGIVIAPHHPQPRNGFASHLQEKFILSVTGDVFKSQGNVELAEEILTNLIHDIKKNYLQTEADYASPQHRLKAIKELGKLIYLCRKEIEKKLPSNPNREKLDTYLHTLETNLRYYDVLQKGGNYYLGKDPVYSDATQDKVLTKNNLSEIDRIDIAQIHPDNNQLYTLYRKGKIENYVYVSKQGARCIPTQALPSFLDERNFTVSPSQKTDVQQTKMHLLKLFMTQEFKDIDAAHKIWVNSAPSNNPCAHELLMLSAGGRVKGYVNIDALHDVVSYIPKDEFDDYLRKNNRTVMGIQHMPIKNTANFRNKLCEYIEKKWLAAAFFHNCANFTDELAHAGGVSYSRLNPSYSGDYDHIQYPIKRLQILKELGALHTTKEEGEQRPEDDKLKIHIKSVKEEFRRQAIQDNIPAKKHEDYIRYRAKEGLPHKKAKQKVTPSPSSSFSACELIVQFASMLNPIIILSLFSSSSNRPDFGLFSRKEAKSQAHKEIDNSKYQPFSYS